MSFRLEPGNHLVAVHAGLDDLEGDLALHRLRLLGHEDRAHAAFADLLQELVRADSGANRRLRRMRHRLVRGTRLIVGGCGRGDRRLLQKAARRGLGRQHFLDSAAEVQVAGAGRFEIDRTLLGRALFQGGKEDHFEGRKIVHVEPRTGRGRADEYCVQERRGIDISASVDVTDSRRTCRPRQVQRS